MVSKEETGRDWLSQNLQQNNILLNTIGHSLDCMSEGETATKAISNASDILEELKGIKQELSNISVNTRDNSIPPGLLSLDSDIEGLNENIEALNKNVVTLNATSQKILSSSKNLERLTFALIIMTMWLITTGIASISSTFANGSLSSWAFAVILSVITGTTIFLSILYVRNR